MYILEYGSLAYKLEPIEKEEVIKEKKVNKVPKAPKQKLNFKVIFFAVLISFSAYFMISKQVAVFETEKEVKNLQTQLDGMKSKEIQKNFELEQSVDLETIEEVATSKLSMQRPEKNQKVYVNITSDDLTEITSDENESVKSKVSKKAKNVKKNIVGIFSLGW